MTTEKPLAELSEEQAGGSPWLALDGQWPVLAAGVVLRTITLKAGTEITLRRDPITGRDYKINIHVEDK